MIVMFPLQRADILARLTANGCRSASPQFVIENRPGFGRQYRHDSL